MRGLNILVVDDDIADRKLFRRLLGDNELAATISEAETADGALAFSDRAFDAIFLDYHLPMTTGLNALTTFRETWPRAAVLLMTGQGDETVAKSAIMEGASDYLSKAHLNAVRLVGVLKNAVIAARMRTRLEEQRDDLATFAEVLVHDFRAPIRAAAYLTEQIEEDLDSGNDDEVRHSLSVLRGSALQMINMLGSLSDHIRYDRDEAFEAARPEKLLECAIKTVEHEVSEASAVIETSASIDIPPIRCQPPQIIQVLQNLIANALKYSGDGAPKIALKISEDSCGMIVFDVTDSGIGIPSEFKERVFEPFKRVPNSSQTTGTGLGLATCKKVVQRHGGRIWCDSEIGSGTSVRFTLPVSTLPDEAPTIQNHDARFS